MATTAADILNAGKKIAILVGCGALRATDELEKTAEVLGAPIIKALLGKAAVPDDSLKQDRWVFWEALVPRSPSCPA